jgi:hypothetical protein
MPTIILQNQYAMSEASSHMHGDDLQILIPELCDKHVLGFRVMDRDKLGADDTTAEYDIKLNKDSGNKNTEFLRTGEEVPMTLMLKPPSGSMERKSGQPAGEMYVLMQYTPFFNAQTQVDDDDPGKAMEKIKVRLPLHSPGKLTDSIKHLVCLTS